MKISSENNKNKQRLERSEEGWGMSVLAGNIPAEGTARTQASLHKGIGWHIPRATRKTLRSHLTWGMDSRL